MGYSNNIDCQHPGLQVDVSPHAAQAGYSRPPLPKRVAATTPSGRVVSQKTGDSDTLVSEYTFPGPLVLPEDSLAIDPKEPPQSLRSFIQEGARNPLTKRRKTLYIGRVSNIAAGVSQMKTWSTPSCLLSASKNSKTKESIPQPPNAEHVRQYLEAFYHPLMVKHLPGPVSFIPWADDSASTDRSRRKGGKVSSSEPFVGLQIGKGVTRVRTRPCPDEAFSRQINLNDVMDALIEAVPDDAHSAILLVDQDMFDDEEDIFCCGLAYGGSRVAVISTARYHPGLDDNQDMYGDEVLDRQHMWPASHCTQYVKRMCGIEAEPKRKKAEVNQASQRLDVEGTALGAALKAAMAAPDPDKDLEGMWFSRVARTAAHELGHCFAIGHCVYYACSMQGTSCIAEDMRQPPYLCPICLAKVTRAIADVERGLDTQEFVLQRYKALFKFCEKRLQVTMFAGFHAWLGKRIEDLEEQT